MGASRGAVGRAVAVCWVGAGGFAFVFNFAFGFVVGFVDDLALLLGRRMRSPIVYDRAGNKTAAPRFDCEAPPRCLDDYAATEGFGEMLESEAVGVSQIGRLSSRNPPRPSSRFTAVFRRRWQSLTFVPPTPSAAHLSRRVLGGS